MARKGLRCVYSFSRRWTSAYFYDTEAVNRDKKINENFIGGVAIDLNEHALSITHSWMAMAFLLR